MPVFVILSLVVAGLLIVVMLLQVYQVIAVQRVLRRYRKVEQVAALVNDFPPLSVVIFANNQEKNLLTFLPSILEQDYPIFEVIVVNDLSDDESEAVLNDFKAQHKKLKIVHLKANERYYRSGRKFALTMGVKAAIHEWLVFTDANCRPQSNQWLRLMARNFDQNTEIVLGYSPYERARGFLNKLIRYDAFQTGIDYLSLALRNKAYMGIGRNIAYRKSLFFKSKGFASHMHIMAGDDDLFVNENATSTNTKICISADAQVWSTPETTYAAHKRQKRRYIGTKKAYKRGHQIRFTIKQISVAFFYLMSILLLFLAPHWWYIVVGCWTFRWFILYLSYRASMKKLQVKDLWLSIIYLDVYYHIYTFAMGLRMLFNRKKSPWR